MKKVILLLLVLFGFTATSWATTISDLANWTWTDSSNKTHHYWVIEDHVTWDQAFQTVSGFGDKFYLATITSQEEQDFMEAGLARFSGEYWLGGVQAPGMDPLDGWEWSNGEAFEYTNWKTGEPNDWGKWDERHLGTWSRYQWQWNDEHGRANIKGYIVEAIPNPEPTTMLLFGFGLLGVAGIGRKTLSA